MKKILIMLVLMLITSASFSQLSKMRESYYQNGFSIIMKGEKEVVLDDQTRVDIVTDTFAIEVDFAKKWAESIGQSYHYAKKLNKKPGILLIVNGYTDDRFVKILMPHAIELGITVWLMDYNTDNWCRVNVITEFSYNFK